MGHPAVSFKSLPGKILFLHSARENGAGDRVHSLLGFASRDSRGGCRHMCFGSLRLMMQLRR
jgi:hypothetical protein